MLCYELQTNWTKKTWRTCEETVREGPSQSIKAKLLTEEDDDDNDDVLLDLVNDNMEVFIFNDLYLHTLTTYNY